MIDITLNATHTDNKICLTDVPNILKIEDTGAMDNARKSYLYFTFVGTRSLPVTGDGQYHLYVEGETISNVTNPENAINKNFFINRNSDSSTAASIAAAFRNCPTIAANWNVQQSGNIVKLDAKTPFQTDTQSYFNGIIPSNWNGTVHFSGFDAQNPSQLTGAKVQVDIYKVTNYENEYITTLEKTCNINEVSFNLSPVLTTFAEYGKATEFQYRVNSIDKQGNFNQLNDPADETNYISVGYMVNQGQKYLFNNDITIAQNFSRGNAWAGDMSTRGVIVNSQLLYLYEPMIPISFYRGNAGGATIYIDYRDSALNMIGSATTEWQSYDSRKVLIDTGYTINMGQEYKTYFDNSFYIDFTLGYQTIRYNVIKPLYATEGNQRIYFRNSYGGVSFIDFTGKKSETRNLELSTYRKNIYDFYPTQQQLDNENYYAPNYINELEKIYDNDVDYQVTLKSHLFEEDGKYIYNDLLQSSRVWTEVNGQKYAIILNSVSVEEIDTNNNIYEATITYHYSQKPSLI